VLINFAMFVLGLIPQPVPTEPPGVGTLVNDLGGWLFWGCGAGILIGILGVAIRLSVGRGRSQMSASAIGDLPFIFFAGMLAVSAGVLATAVIGF